MLELLRRRRSIRKYTGEAIPEDLLGKILQAGLLAPSSRAVYPVEFIVVREKSTLEKMAHAKKGGAGMLAGADTAIVVIGDTERSDAWIEDCSIAMTHMYLEAARLGIGACWVQCRGRVSEIPRREEDKKTAGRDMPQPAEYLSADERLHMLLSIPENYSVEAILSLGMPAEEKAAYDLPDPEGPKVHRETY